jgi:hypothetical protein
MPSLQAVVDAAHGAVDRHADPGVLVDRLDHRAFVVVAGADACSAM